MIQRDWEPDGVGSTPLLPVHVTFKQYGGMSSKRGSDNGVSATTMMGCCMSIYTKSNHLNTVTVRFLASLTSSPGKRSAGACRRRSTQD